MSAYGYSGWGWFPRSLTVAERKAKAAKMAAKLAKEGRRLDPVELEGRTIARTFWGKAWCDNIESYRDYAYRLERGRSYVRSGAVLDLKITRGRAEALVAGSESRPYRVAVEIAPADPAKWKALAGRALGKILSLLALTQGKVPEALLEDFCKPSTGLFPAPREIRLDCSCPDVAGCCKHVAAALYGIGARLDREPELFFALRSIDPAELVAEEAVEQLTGGGGSEIADGDLGAMFGIELDEEAAADASAAAPAKRKPGRPRKKAAAAEPAAPKRRGRPKKAGAAPSPEPPKKRGRPRKTAASAPAPAVEVPPPKTKPKKAAATKKPAEAKKTSAKKAPPTGSRRCR